MVERVRLSLFLCCHQVFAAADVFQLVQNMLIPANARKGCYARRFQGQKVSEEADSWILGLLSYSSQPFVVVLYRPSKATYLRRYKAALTPLRGARMICWQQGCNEGGTRLP